MFVDGSQAERADELVREEDDEEKEREVAEEDVEAVEEADEARRFVEDSMRWRPLWALDLPLACESGMGASYGDC